MIHQFHHQLILLIYRMEHIDNHYRHRSPSRSWSERPPLRHDSTTSSYDTNGSVIHGRRSTTSNGSSTYAPGVQRVAQSSTWYKPRTFTPKITNGNTNGHSTEPPKPLPRYSKIGKLYLIIENVIHIHVDYVNFR